MQSLLVCRYYQFIIQQEMALPCSAVVFIYLRAQLLEQLCEVIYPVL